MSLDGIVTFCSLLFCASCRIMFTGWQISERNKTLSACKKVIATYGSCTFDKTSRQ